MQYFARTGAAELSGAPLKNIHQTCDEVHTHLAQVKEIAGELGVGMLGAGFIPKWKREDISWMPRGAPDMPTSKEGNLGLDMMLRSAVQVNLVTNRSCGENSARRWRQPVATALFALRRPSVRGGYQSYRSHLWKIPIRIVRLRSSSRTEWG